jgi:mRNA turnover protein 4
LVKGKVVLEMEGGYPVCKTGDTLDSRQTTLLKIFRVPVAEFNVDVKVRWSREGGEVTVVEREDEMDVSAE